MSGDDWHAKSHGYEPTHIQNMDADIETSSSNTADYKRYNFFSPTEWLLELLTSVASLVLLMGIVAIFIYMDGKPLSHWDSSVSLNAIISVLTTVCTAALMHNVSESISQLKWLHFKRGPRKLANLQTFDAASRGTWGSIQLLTTVKWNLATIGALVTICQVVFSPLAQQVVMLEQQVVDIPDDTATFGYAHMYDRDTSEKLFSHKVGSYPQDPGMQSAILQGLYDINSPATFSCPGACSWNESYMSLGFKSECKNVTEETLRSSDCFSSDENSSLTYCNMTTPGGFNISTRWMNTGYSTTYRMSAFSDVRNSLQFANDSGSPELCRFAVYRSTPDYNFQAHDINITDCSVSLAVYEYTNAHSNGSEFSFGETREVDFGGKNPWGWGGDVYSRLQLYTNKSETYGTPALALSWPDLQAMLTYFESDTIVTEWVDGNWENTNIGLSAALMGDVDLGKRFDRMAASMTDYLRAGPNGKLALGQRSESVPFVFIRWKYMIGPFAIELTALFFAAFTIFHNRRSRRVPLWKSSVLAIFACQYEDQSGMIKTTVRDIKQIEKTAQKALVQLE